MRPLVLWGGTGQAVVLDDFAGHLGCRVAAIIDNNTDLKSPIEEVPVFNDTGELAEYLGSRGLQNVCFAMAIGGSRGKDRCELAARLKELGLSPLLAVHPSASVSTSARLGEGVQIMANAAVCARVEAGDYTIVNTSAVVDHECRLGSGVHIGPGAVLTGLVEVGDFSFIGAGAVVLPGIRIGSHSIVGAGSVVTEDIPGNAIYKGVPAKFTKHNESQVL